MEMDLRDQNREQWVKDLLADLDLASLTDSAEPPFLSGATGPRPLELELGEVFIEPVPVQYSFDAHDTRLDIFPGALIFHFCQNNVGSHQRLQKIFQKVSEENKLSVEALWFGDTLSSQMALVRVERAR